MSAVEEKLRKMGYTLPPTFKFPNPNRTGCVVVGSIVFVSGHGRDLPPAERQAAGKVGRDLTVEEGYATARAVGAVHPCQPQATARRSRSDQAGRAAVRNGQRGARFRPDAAGHRRGVGFLLRAVRSGNVASTHARRSGSRNSRTASRSRSTGNSSFAHETSRENGSQRQHPGRVRRSASNNGTAPARGQENSPQEVSHGCSLASHRNFGSGS